MSEKKAPKLRFKGYTDDWVQCKLGDVGKAQSGVGFPNSEQGGKSGIPFYKVSDMNIKGNEQEMTIANNYVTNEQINRKKWTPIKNVPAIFFAKVGAAVLLNRKRLCRKPFLMDNNTMAYSMNQNHLNAVFSRTLFETINLASLVQVGALPSYNAQDIENIKIGIPNLNEQKKIADYFKNIDSLIALQQRKLSKLNKVKKALLQQMFPEQSSKIPKTRFSKFTDPWEQQKLGEVANSVEYGINAPAKEYDGINKYLRITDIDDTTHKFLQSDLTSPDIDLTLAKKFKLLEGDILFARTGASVGKTYIYNKDDGIVYYAGFLIRMRFNQSTSPNFIFQNTLTLAYKQYVEVSSQRSGQPGVNAKEYSNYSLCIPSPLEQQKIGNFLKQFDSLIALHQRKLDQLKQVKKFLLQNMFI